MFEVGVQKIITSSLQCKKSTTERSEALPYITVWNERVHVCVELKKITPGPRNLTPKRTLFKGAWLHCLCIRQSTRLV